MAAPDEAPDLTAAPAAQAEVPPELVAQTFGEYARAYVARVRNGQSGVLPVVLGLVAIMVVFEVISPNHVFLSAGNLVNLFQQSAVFMVLAMAETFALLLGEIDLSIGFVGACGAVIAVQLVQPVTTTGRGGPRSSPRWPSVSPSEPSRARSSPGWGYLRSSSRLQGSSS